MDNKTNILSKNKKDRRPGPPGPQGYSGTTHKRGGPRGQIFKKIGVDFDQNVYKNLENCPKISPGVASEASDGALRFRM